MCMESILEKVYASETGESKEEVKDPGTYGKVPSQEEFDKMWKESILPSLKNRQFLYASLKSEIPQLSEEGKFAISFENSALMSAFEKELTRIREMVAEKYGEYKLSFKPENRKINEEEKNKYLVTGQEIYNYMKEKNPLLDDLRKYFHLKIDN